MLRAQLKEKFFESQLNQNGTSVNTKFAKPPTSGTKLYYGTPLPESKFIESEPINAYFKNNRVVHRNYLKVTNEHLGTLRELLKQARALKTLDENLVYASKFAVRIRELLEYPFIGRVSYTNASGSKPRSNTKNDRIQQPSCRSKKNKVEAQPRKSKSSSNTNNHVSVCNANIKSVALSKNSANVCLSCNEGLKWIPMGRIVNLIVEIILWYLDSGCSKHMTGHRDKLINFVSKFIATVRFSSGHFATIMGYGDLQIENIIISRVYYVEGLGHNLFSVGKFCDSDLEGFAAALAVLITGASQSTQHGKSEPPLLVHQAVPDLLRVHAVSETRPSESIVLSATLMPQPTGPASGSLPVVSLKSQPNSYSQCLQL
ncbi:hypothetical protein Tco_1517854 [Tanacetum coccineum]